MNDVFFNQYIKLLNEMKDKSFGGNLSEYDFIRSMVLLNPQSYGNRIEKRLIEKFKGVPVSSKIDKGDMIVNKLYYEIKTSILFNNNNNLNLVQLRLWQDIDFYLCVVYDLRNGKFEQYTFLLSKSEMIKESQLCNMSSAHGTKKANKANLNIELRYSLVFKENNPVLVRWLEKYRIKNK